MRIVLCILSCPYIFISSWGQRVSGLAYNWNPRASQNTSLLTTTHPSRVLAALYLQSQFGSVWSNTARARAQRGKSKNRLLAAIASIMQHDRVMDARIHDKHSHEEHWPPALLAWLRGVNGFEYWGRSLSLPAPMEYAILHGRSSVQSLQKGDAGFVCDHKQLLAVAPDSEWSANDSRCKTSAAWAVSGAMLWLLGKEDLAHEALLGTFNIAGIDSNIELFLGDLKIDGWRERHGLSQEQVLLHAALHRAEGPLEADGLSLTGYQNAKIWYDRLDPKHPVLEHLVRFAKQYAPLVAQRCVVSHAGVERSIPVRQPGLTGAAAWSGPGRSVRLESGQWDPYAFIDLCKELRDNEHNSSSKHLELYREAVRVQQEELMECFGMSVRIATAISS